MNDKRNKTQTCRFTSPTGFSENVSVWNTLHSAGCSAAVFL